MQNTIRDMMLTSEEGKTAPIAALEEARDIQRVLH
jgi:hypothetical protein